MTPKPHRRPEVRSVALLGVLAAAGCQSWRSTPAPDSTGATTVPPSNVADRSAGRPQLAVPPEVRLDAAIPVHPGPVESGRNPFRLGSRSTVPPPATGDRGSQRPAGDRGSEPFDAPSGTRAATAPLKFIGIVEAPDSVGKVAVLSDGRSVYYGRQDDIIEGRYRIVRIGVESIDLEFLDGGGRETVRLSGS